MKRVGIYVVVTCAMLLVTNAVAQAQTQRSNTDHTNLKLPVSLDRIKRQLSRSEQTAKNGSILRLSYYVDVYSRSPAVDLIRNTFDLSDGPVPYGAPTHQEMLNAMTPRQWRAPAINLNHFFGWTMKSLNAPR